MKDIERKGHPFSFVETKPLSLLQRIFEHHGITHMVDFTAGSAAMAIAASGALEYEGLAGNEEHSNWLDSTLDRCVMYLAGKDSDYAKRLGVADESLEQISNFFSG